MPSMQDHELYRRILGIEAPWFVDSVDLKLEAGEIHVYLRHHEMINWPCPECGADCKLYDHQPERRWRHLDTCQYQTILHAEPPRSECREHGVKVVKLPWAEPSSRFTALLEALAIDWLKAASQKAVAGLLKLSWDEIHGIMERAVQRGLGRRQAELVGEIGVDEKAFRKGHSYLTLVNDLVRGRVLYVAEDRKQSSLDSFWEMLTTVQISGIRAVAMDMWDPYIASVREHVPEADGKIVFDKFHVAKHLGEAVDKVRRKEHKTLKAAGDDRLAGTRYDWLRNPAMMEPKDRKEFAELRNSELKTARAWALKETAMALYDYVYERPARKHFRWWHGWAGRNFTHWDLGIDGFTARIRDAVPEVGDDVLEPPLEHPRYLDHRFQPTTARGFRNRQNFVHAIYFHCGGLNLAPEATK
jgi:transposase